VGAVWPAVEDDESFLSNLPALYVSEPGQPPYKTPLGRLFDQDWVTQAKEQQRRAMKQAPADIRYDDHVETKWTGTEAKALDLADWEKDIIMYSLYVILQNTSL
jgi:hypothetical protein